MNNSLNLAFGAVSGDVKPASEAEIRAVKTFRDAIRLCIKLAPVKRTQNDLACLAGINATQFSKIINGAFHLPTDKIPVIEKLCGNTAITQWLAAQHGATLHIKTAEERLAECQAELEALKARAA